MHWTDLLQKRLFPPHAAVIDNLACVSCGYNLRGLRVAGKCPECGRPIDDSLLIIPKPNQLAQSLRTLGWGYLIMLLLVLGCLPVLLGPNMVFVGGIILWLGSWFRLLAMRGIRYECGIEKITLLARNIHWLWTLTLIDVAAGFTVLALTFLRGAATAFSGSMLLTLIALGFAFWQIVILISAVQANSIGSALAGMIEHEQTSRQFRLTKTLFLVFALVLGLSVLAMLATLAINTSGHNWIAVSPACSLIVLMLMLASYFVVTWSALLRLATAVERERGPRDDVIDAEREMVGPRLRAQRKQIDDLPPIELDEDENTTS